MKFDREGIVTYVSPVLNALDVPQIGSKVSEHDLETLMKVLVQALEEAAGLRPKTQCLQQFVTDKTVALSGKTPVISFSGGVADLIDAPQTDWLEYGDLGVLLGRAIRASKLCKTSYTLGRETLRATVAGAGTYSTELSGSTIYYNNVSFPLQNLPVVALLETDLSADCIKAKTAMYEDGCTAVALRGKNAPTYEEILLLADLLAESLGARSNPLVAVLEADMAKALGQALRCRLGPEKEIVCLDGLHIPEGSYLDIGAPVAGGAAIPVVIKTLAFI